MTISAAIENYGAGMAVDVSDISDHRTMRMQSVAESIIKPHYCSFKQDVLSRLCLSNVFIQKPGQRRAKPLHMQQRCDRLD